MKSEVWAGWRFYLDFPPFAIRTLFCVRCWASKVARIDAWDSASRVAGCIVLAHCHDRDTSRRILGMSTMESRELRREKGREEGDRRLADKRRLLYISAEPQDEECLRGKG